MRSDNNIIGNVILVIFLGVSIGLFVLLYKRYVCRSRCEPGRCNVSDGCEGICHCQNKTNRCINNQCISPVVAGDDDVDNKRQLNKATTTTSCTNESEYIMRGNTCTDCCKDLIPYKDGMCHKYPYSFSEVDYDPPSCVSNKPKKGCTAAGRDMYENSGLCLPCCEGLSSYLQVQNQCTDNEIYTFSCYDQASPPESDNFFLKNPDVCQPFIPT